MAATTALRVGIFGGGIVGGGVYELVARNANRSLSI